MIGGRVISGSRGQSGLRVPERPRAMTSAASERRLAVLARPDLARREDRDLARQRGTQQRQWMLVGPLRRHLRHVPLRRVDKVDAVLGEPLRDLQVVVEILTARLTEIFERQPHAHGNRRRHPRAHRPRATRTSSIQIARRRRPADHAASGRDRSTVRSRRKTSAVNISRTVKRWPTRSRITIAPFRFSS